ncbi:MAG: D-aminoacylase, partial [Pirellula sp.]
ARGRKVAQVPPTIWSAYFFGTIDRDSIMSSNLQSVFFMWICVAGNCILSAQEVQFDLVLRGGKIVDGTGNPWRLGDVAIRNDRIVAVGRIPDSKPVRELDVTGLVIAPGFIDIHSHSDYVLLEDGQALSKLHQGVTTEVLGEGSSAGPYRGTVVNDAATAGSRRYSTLASYFHALETAGTTVNVASYVGLDNIWRSVMGTSFDRPTPAQIEEMKKILDEAMRDGGLGLSTMLAMPPGSLATTDDLVNICEVVRRYGGIYSTHNRNEGTDVFAAVTEAIAIGERAKIPVDIIHLKIADQSLWGRMNEIVAIIEQARQRGVDVGANVYPYTRGNNNLASIIPPWAHEGGVEAMIERLKNSEVRKRMKKDIESGIPGWYNHYTAVGGDWSRMLISGKCPYEGMTMDRVIAIKRKDNPTVTEGLDILFDLLIEQSGSISTVYEHHTESDMNLAMVQSWCSIGSDGSAFAIEGPLRRGNPHPRNFGTFPRVLGVYCRERGMLRLEDAVRKMTSLNASKIGIRNRGLLVPGAMADITVFSEGKIIDQSTYQDPFQYNRGVEWVLVNGQIVLEKGVVTKSRPGRVLRRVP